MNDDGEIKHHLKVPNEKIAMEVKAVLGNLGLKQLFEVGIIIMMLI